MRGQEHTAEVVVRDLTKTDPGRCPGEEECFRPPHVPDPCDEALVEESVAELAALVVAAKPLDHAVEIGWVDHDVRAEAGELSAGELQDGAVPLHGFPLASA